MLNTGENLDCGCLNVQISDTGGLTGMVTRINRGGVLFHGLQTYGYIGWIHAWPWVRGVSGKYWTHPNLTTWHHWGIKYLQCGWNSGTVRALLSFPLMLGWVFFSPSVIKVYLILIIFSLFTVIIFFRSSKRTKDQTVMYSVSGGELATKRLEGPNWKSCQKMMQLRNLNVYFLRRLGIHGKLGNKSRTSRSIQADFSRWILYELILHDLIWDFSVVFTCSIF